MVLTTLKKWIVVLVSAGLLLTACGTSRSNLPTNPDLQNVLPPDVALNVQNQISATMAVAVENIQLQKVEKMDWPNSCLGLPKENESCTEVVTPGWLLTFNINGQDYKYRVDQTGTVIRQEP
jgi:hypothetical protein